jgi:hypothetical protein
MLILRDLKLSVHFRSLCQAASTSSEGPCLKGVNIELSDFCTSYETAERAGAMCLVSM